MNEQVAELCGLHAGDGTLYRTNKGSVWELRGGHDEQEFYDEYIRGLLESLSDVSFRFGFRSGGTYGVRSCSMQFIQILLDAGFSFGSKTYTVRVPQWIREGNTKCKAAFLRGIYATDGCVTLVKINGKDTPRYPKISLTSASKHLIEDILRILESLGFTAGSSRNEKQYRIDLNGKRQLRKFHTTIGITQPKHVDRVKRYI